MSNPTIHDNFPIFTQRADGPFAKATLSAEFGRQGIMGAVTRPERGAPFSACAAAPTIRSRGEGAASDDVYDTLLDDYQILDKLCIGAEAQLFIARRLYDNEHVVLKIYHPGISPSEEVLKKVKLCPHENIVKLHAYGRISQNGQFYEVQDHLPGATLTTVLGFHPLDEYSCLLILQQVARALDHLHSLDAEGCCLIHRDIKPDNILTQSHDDHLKLVLCDFGISRIIRHGSDNSGLEKDCTPCYASPETYIGNISTKSDFWSLGMVLLEAITGRHPFAGVSDSSIESHLRNGWQPELDPFQSPHWRELFGGLLRPDPDERWGYGEVENWLALESGQEKKSDAEQPDDTAQPFAHLRSKSAEELAARLASHWYQVSQLLDDVPFRCWLANEITRIVPDRQLTVLLDDPVQSDNIRLLRLIYRLCSTLPHGWKEWSLDRQEFVDHCRRAIGGNIPMQEMVGELYDLCVLDELAHLTSDDVLRSRATEWKGAVAEFSVFKGIMERCGAPAGLFLSQGQLLPRLYLLVCEGEEGLACQETEISTLLLFSYPWLQLVQDFQLPYSPVQRYVKAIAMSFCLAENSRNFKVTHDLNATAERINSEPVRQIGWNPPTIEMSAEHIDYYMTISESQTTVAKGVRLSWNVRRAAIVYLTRFGLVSGEGRRPNERMTNWATYRPLDSCQCNHHNASWFTIGETTTFSLIAIGAGGICVHRLPPIVVPAPVLEQRARLEVAIPQLSPLEEFIVETPQLLPQFVLFPVTTIEVDAMGREDLLPQIELCVPALGRGDLYPQERFIN